MSEPQEPPVFYAGRPVPADPAPGTVIHRWTDNRPNLTVATTLPCHETQEVTVLNRAVGVVVICRLCSSTYRLTVVDDLDGGFTAELTVSAERFQLSRAARRRST